MCACWKNKDLYVLVCAGSLKITCMTCLAKYHCEKFHQMSKRMLALADVHQDQFWNRRELFGGAWHWFGVQGRMAPTGKTDLVIIRSSVNGQWYRGKTAVRFFRWVFYGCCPPYMLLYHRLSPMFHKRRCMFLCHPVKTLNDFIVAMR